MDTVGEYLLKEIKNLGVKEIFGIPGDMVIRLFKIIEDDSDLTLFTFSHEPGVGFAAIGSARATRRPAVACVTYGAGGLNLINSVACAYAEKTPLIIISGGPGEGERVKNEFVHHVVKDFDSQLRIYQQITQEAVILENRRTAHSKIRAAMRACQAYMLPVYIEVPRDLVDKNIMIDKGEDPYYPHDEKGTKEAVSEILFRISQARTPVILVGVEADRFALKDSILRLVKRLNIPMVTTFLSRDVVPTDDPNYFGTYLGLAGNPVARELVEKSDCLLMLGGIITDMNLGLKLKRLKRENLIQCVSRQVNIGHHVYDDVPLKALIDEFLTRRIEKKAFVFPQRFRLEINRECKYTGNLLSMKEVIDAINWFFSEYEMMPIISDTADCLFATTKIEAPTIMASAYYATMGFAIPAAIGYAVTVNKRPLVLVGDGSFQMTGQEICHCPRFNINPIFIVFNNRSWGLQQVFYPTAGFNELVNWPYTRLAEMWGGRGYLCDTCEKLYRALRCARDDREFSLIEVLIKKAEYSEELLAWYKEISE